MTGAFSQSPGGRIRIFPLWMLFCNGSHCHATWGMNGRLIGGWSSET